MKLEKYHGPRLCIECMRKAEWILRVGNHSDHFCNEHVMALEKVIFESLPLMMQRGEAPTEKEPQYH